MQGYETAVWVLIALPVLMGILAVPLKKKGHLLTVVGANAVIITMLSVYLLYALQGSWQGKPLEIKAEDLATAMGLGKLTIHELILVLDLALLAVFLLLGLYIRSPIVALLAIGQLIPLAWFETTYPTAVEVTAFTLDYLSLVFVLISSIVGSIIVIYGVQYMSEGEHRQGPFFFFMLTFLGVMNGAVLSNNLVYLYFFWECTTLCCYFLIKHEGDPTSLSNARWAAEVTMAGGAALLLGAFMFQNYSGTATLSLMDIVSKTNLPEVGAVVALPIFFFAMAAFTKSAQVPFQSWLLGAMVAPTPVSALLHSSTMVKLGVYLVIRMSPVIHQFEWLVLLIALVGAYSFVSTALLALQEKSMKRLLALSTVGNLGLIIMLAAIGTREAVAAAVLLTIFHAVSKALLFLSAGTVQKVFGRRDIEGSEGLFRRAPALWGAFVIGILTMFLTPFGVFIAKYTALTESTLNPVLILMVVVGSIACEVFYVRWLGRTMAVTGEPVVKEVSALYTGPMWTLAAGAVVLSVTLPLYLSGLLEPIVGHGHLEAAYAYVSLNFAGVIPTALIFLALLFIVYYSYKDTGGKKVAPYTGGMYDYQVELACPYFEQYTESRRNMMIAEVAGAAVMVLAFLGALRVGGVF